MRGLVCCLVALLASSCIQVDGKRDSVTIYKSKKMTGDVVIPVRYSPHEPGVPGEAILHVGSNKDVLFVLATDKGVTSSRLLTVEGTKPPIDPMKPHSHMVLTTSQRHVYRGRGVKDVISVITTVIHFYRDQPIRAVVLIEYIAEFDVKKALENIDIDDEETREIADWFKTFDDLNTKRQRMVVEF